MMYSDYKIEQINKQIERLNRLKEICTACKHPKCEACKAKQILTRRVVGYAVSRYYDVDDDCIIY